MAEQGKHTAFLMDGGISGRIKCKFSNWTGVAFKILRT